VQKRVSVRTACALTELLWPDFIEVSGCIVAAFQCGDGEVKISGDKTGTECFINHTHLLDQFSNRTTLQTLQRVSENLDLAEEAYDYAHPDFIAACELGTKMAKMWALKLKFDFPESRFRIYYTQYDDPIVRFHKVRIDEPFWLSDEALQSATDPSFNDAVIHDTDCLDRPIKKKLA
jgi:hypothetical protein